MKLLGQSFILSPKDRNLQIRILECSLPSPTFLRDSGFQTPRLDLPAHPGGFWAQDYSAPPKHLLFKLLLLLLQPLLLLFQPLLLISLAPMSGQVASAEPGASPSAPDLLQSLLSPSTARGGHLQPPALPPDLLSFQQPRSVGDDGDGDQADEVFHRQHTLLTF